MPVGHRSNSARSRPRSPRAGGSGGASQSGGALPGWSFDDGGAAPSVSPLSRSSRADNCLANSSKALFSTAGSAGDFGSPEGRNGTTFSGSSTGSWAVDGDESSAIQAGVPDGAPSDAQKDPNNPTTSDVVGGPD